MPTVCVDHGQQNPTFDNITDRGTTALRSVTNVGCQSGTFTATAAGTTTVTVPILTFLSGSVVSIFPTNAAGGLLVKGKTCWVDTLTGSTFNFNVSATAVGAPAGTETFSWITMASS
jgi:hypothetical protein